MENIYSGLQTLRSKESLYIFIKNFGRTVVLFFRIVSRKLTRNWFVKLQELIIVLFKKCTFQKTKSLNTETPSNF